MLKRFSLGLCVALFALPALAQTVPSGPIYVSNPLPSILLSQPNIWTAGQSIVPGSGSDLLLGTSTAITTFQNFNVSAAVTPPVQIQGTTPSTSSLSLLAVSDNSNTAPYIYQMKQGATSAAVASGVRLGVFCQGGSDGTNLLNGVCLESYALAAATTGDLSAGLEIYVNNGAATPSATVAITGTGIGVGPGVVSTPVAASLESLVAFTSTTAATWSIGTSTGSQTVGSTTGLTIGATYRFVLAPTSTSKEYATGVVTSSTAINFTARGQNGSSAVSQANGVTITALHLLAEPSDTTAPAFTMDTAGNATIGGAGIVLPSIASFPTATVASSYTLCAAATGGIVGKQTAACTDASADWMKDEFTTWWNPLGEANELRLGTFVWNKSAVRERVGKRDFGFRASEVAAVDPRLAIYDTNKASAHYGQPDGVMYERLGALAIGAIKELTIWNMLLTLWCFILSVILIRNRARG